MHPFQQHHVSTSGGHFGSVCIPFPHLLSGWREMEKVLYQEPCPFPGWRKTVKGGAEGEREREPVQMNNLYRIPGIVCQGDDGRPVSKPKQTDCKNAHTHTHSLSREVDGVIGGCETSFILIAGREELVEQCYTISFCW